MVEPKDLFKPTLVDRGMTGIKALLQTIPCTGGAAEILGAIVRPAAEKRLQRWMEEIANGLKDLQNRFSEFDADRLPENEAFVTVVLQATQVAIRNHQKEKHEALRNAVLNAALRQEDTKQMIFLHFVDELTPDHLRLLRFLENIRAHKLHHPEDPQTVFAHKALLQAMFPDIHIYYLELLINQLHQKELIQMDWSKLIEALGMYRRPESVLTNVGEEFMAFIKSPIPDC